MRAARSWDLEAGVFSFIVATFLGRYGTRFVTSACEDLCFDLISALRRSIWRHPTMTRLLRLSGLLSIMGAFCGKEATMRLWAGFAYNDVAGSSSSEVSVLPPRAVPAP